MNLELLLKISFYVTFVTTSIWLSVTQFSYYKALRKKNEKSNISFTDLTSVSSEETVRFFADLFSGKLRDNKLRLEILNVRYSLLAICLSILYGIVIFNVI